LDAARNNSNAPIITTEGSHVTVRVIRTDEELQIARAVLQLLGHTQERTA
jgi:acetate kinase